MSEDSTVAGDGEGSHRGVERIARIMAMTAASTDGLRLAELSKGLGAPRSSVYSLLKGLVDVDYLIEREGRYLVGPGIRRLLAPSATAALVEVARDEVEGLNRLFDETALLGAVIDDEVVYLLQVESSHSIHYTAKLGEPRNMYPTSTGKLVMAGRDESTLISFRAGLSPSEAVEFDRQIGLARRTGLAYNREETVKGVTAVAAGIHADDGSIIGALVVVGPVYRMGDRLQEMGPDVRAAADRVSRRLSTTDLGLG
jgi:DNA-binding IclR family transcriptional regulator